MTIRAAATATATPRLLTQARPTAGAAPAAPAATGVDTLKLSAPAAAASPALGVAPGDASAQAFLVSASAAAKRGDGLRAVADFKSGLEAAVTFRKALDFAMAAQDLNQPLYATWAFTRATDLAAATGNFHCLMTVAREASRVRAGVAEAYALRRALDCPRNADHALAVHQLATQDNLPFLPDMAARQAATLRPGTIWSRFVDFFDSRLNAGYSRPLPL